MIHFDVIQAVSHTVHAEPSMIERPVGCRCSGNEARPSPALAEGQGSVEPHGAPAFPEVFESATLPSLPE